MYINDKFKNLIPTQLLKFEATNYHSLPFNKIMYGF